MRSKMGKRRCYADKGNLVTTSKTESAGVERLHAEYVLW